jgi:purine-cytosine permease-like protein
MNHDHMDLIYFWSAILIVLLPVAVFVAIAYWLGRMYWRTRRHGGPDNGG